MSYDANIKEWYQNYLGRAPDPEGYNHYMHRLNQGHNIYEVAADIQNSGEARGRRQTQSDNRQAAATLAASNATALSGLQSQIGGYQDQISGFESQIGDYRNQVSGLQNQYNDAMGQVSTWQTKAGEFETSARDWEDQFTTKSQEYETARDEAERYRNEAVGQQLRAMKSGASSGGSNSTTQQGGLASGRSQFNSGDDKVDVEKNIKAESGALSGKGAVVQKINSRSNRPSNAQARPNQGLAAGSTSGYYASRFG